MGGILGVFTGGFTLEKLLISLISSAIVVFITMPIHEFAHGFAAEKLGDPTARYNGRLSLNPKAHLDPFGALMIFLMGVGWAKPVPIDSRYFARPKRDTAITAVAGPLANLLLAFVSLFVGNAVYFGSLLTNSLVIKNILDFVYMIFLYIAMINISLAVFNLVPIPPLDGSKILAAFLPDRTYYRLMAYERWFSLILFALIFFSTRFSNILSGSVYGVIRLFDWLTWLPFDLILKFI